MSTKALKKDRRHRYVKRKQEKIRRAKQPPQEKPQEQKPQEQKPQDGAESAPTST